MNGQQLFPVVDIVSFTNKFSDAPVRRPSLETNLPPWFALEAQTFLDGAVVLALLVVGNAAVAKGGGIIWVELDRLVEVLDGAVVVALTGVGIAAVTEGGG